MPLFNQYVDLVSNQTAGGNKTWSGTTNLSALTASRPISLDSSKNIVNTAYSLTDSNFATAAWSTWSPTLTASGSMTFTSTSIATARYIQVGKIVMFQIEFTGTVGGTPDTNLQFTLPVTAAATAGLVGGAVALDPGNFGGYYISLSTSQVAGRRYDSNSWSAGAGRGFRAIGLYEAA